MASPSEENIGTTAVLVIPAQPRREEARDDRPPGSDDPSPPAARGSGDWAGEKQREGPPEVRAARSGTAVDTSERVQQVEDLLRAATDALEQETPPPPLIGGALPAAVQVAVLVAASDLDDRGFADPEIAARAVRAVSAAVFGDAETAALAATAAAYATAALAAAEAFTVRSARPAQRPQPSPSVSAASATAARTKAAARAMAVGDLGAASREISQLRMPPEPADLLAPVTSARSLPQLCDLLADLDADVRRQWRAAVEEPVQPWLVPEYADLDSAEGDSADLDDRSAIPGPGEGGLMRDLTIARRVEAVLRAEHDWLQEAFEQSPVALLTAALPAGAKDGVPFGVRAVRRANRAASALTGFTETELLTGHLDALLRARPASSAVAPQPDSDLGVREGLQRWTRADGQDICVQVRMRPVWRGPDSEPFAVCAVEEVVRPPSG